MPSQTIIQNSDYESLKTLYKAKNGLHHFDLNGDTKQGLNLGGCIAQR